MRPLRPNIFEVGAIDWNRKLFDQLIPLPDGTTYNAYLIKGSEKTALLDTVDPAKTEILISNLIKTGVDKIDFVISHHAEQDHSGSIPDILLLYPEAKVVTNEKCKNMLIDHLHIEEDKFITIEDGQILSLGDKTLEFIFTPWVHWPETMSTYLQEDKILFSCDFFGSHYSTSSLFVDDERMVIEAAKRYYAEIMMPFRTAICNNLKKLEKLDIDVIAASHGPVYDKPELIINSYKDWTGPNVKNQVVLPYLSMHGSTEKIVDYFIDALMERSITVIPIEIVDLDPGKLTISLVDAATLVIASPTVLVGPHPCAASAAILANAVKPKTKFASIIGSYGWGGKMVDHLKSMMSNLKVEFIEAVLVKGLPKDNDFKALDELADQIVLKHKELGILN